MRAQSQSVRCPDELVAADTHRGTISQVYPAHCTGGVDQEFGGPRNVHPFGATSDVPEIEGADDFLFGI